MNASKTLLTPLFILLVSLAAGILPATVQATTYNIPSGQTTVAFSPQFFNLIPALGAKVSKINPAKTKGSLNKQNLRAIFPIATGALDASSDRVQIGHKGGLTLSTGSNTTVQFVGFSIDFRIPGGSDAALAGNRVMTALVVVNGSIVGRLPVFNLGIDSVASSVSGSTIKINDVALTLTQEAADALNTLFNLPGPSGGSFFGGFPVGTANIKATSVKDLAKM
jgi:hypothetical protein